MKIERIKIRNFKSIDYIDVCLPSYYSAICGKNNSGKSNLIQAIRLILGNESDSPFYPSDDVEVSHQEDYPIWKEKKDEPIQFNLFIKLFADVDNGLIKFIQAIAFDKESLSKSESYTSFDIEISLSYTSGQTQPELKIIFMDMPIESFAANEILNKIRNVKSIIFHNSVKSGMSYGKFHGVFDGFTGSDLQSITKKKEALQKELKNISNRHKKLLSELIGRLNDKYDIDFNLPGLNIERIPFEISLGEKGFEIPLENWGSGTKNRTLILNKIFNAKKLIESPDSSMKITPVVIIEEPESFLHHSAQAEFGRVLQDLASEFKIQVIVSTHSPFLLSHDYPSSNILLERRIEKRKVRETIKIETSEENWKKPFSLALGIEGPEFDNIKSAFFSNSSSILLVEGDTDKEYFEILKDACHEKNCFIFEGEIFSYNGFGTLTNTVMMKFIKEKYSKVVITFDLDIYNKVKGSLHSLGFANEKDYFPVGIDQGGKRAIEGLLPDSILKKVWNANVSLVQQSTSENKDEAESAKKSLKKLYLSEFKASAKPGSEHYGEFYKLVKKLNNAFKNC